MQSVAFNHTKITPVSAWIWIQAILFTALVDIIPEQNPDPTKSGIVTPLAVILRDTTDQTPLPSS